MLKFLTKLAWLTPILGILGLGGVVTAAQKAIAGGWKPADDLSLAAQLEQFVAQAYPGEATLAADALQIVEDLEPAIEKAIADVEKFQVDLKASQAPKV